MLFTLCLRASVCGMHDNYNVREELSKKNGHFNFVTNITDILFSNIVLNYCKLYDH